MKVLIKDIGPFHNRLVMVSGIISLPSGEVAIHETGDSIPTVVTKSKIGHQNIKICEASDVRVALILDAMEKRDEMDRWIAQEIADISKSGHFATPDTIRTEFMNLWA